MNDDVLVRLRGVTTEFPARPTLGDVLHRRVPAGLRAVDDIDLDVRRGEIIGLVGESGSGKTTLGRTIVGLLRATTGEVVFDGQDTTALRGGEWRRLRRRIQMIFQDPYSSLSPRLRVSSLLEEPYVVNPAPAGERYGVEELLDMVGLPVELASKLPHQLSGGQARRVGIARALALRPDFIVADEPTSGLDVSAAAGVLNLMKDLGDRLGLTYLVITHDLNAVGYIADRIAVMYLGQIVEVGDAERVLDTPTHPYTRALLDAVPEVRRDHRQAELVLLPGEVPSARNPPQGCRFHTRCRHAVLSTCTTAPVTEEVDPGHLVACHRWREARLEPGPREPSVP